MIIDFHSHTFPDKIAAGAVTHLSSVSHTRPFTDGTISNLIDSMRKSGIDYSLNLPVATSLFQVEKVNRGLIEKLDLMKAQGILTLGCMHPDYDNCRRELVFLKEHGIAGIKLHPAYQETDLNDIKNMRIIDAATELGMTVLVHAGIDIGIPGHDYSSVKHILQVIEELHPEKLVLAHMGGWARWDDVTRDLAGADVWFDTAFSIGPLVRAEGDPTPPVLLHNLSDEEFVGLARKHGTHHILFATDSPWADQKDYVDRIRQMPFSESERKQIFEANALKLLDL
ncbi:MAG: amidohydrolase family protein [Eubacterium sp.]|nr:amidohydrolase family protein [Eubacterium sp.]